MTMLSDGMLMGAGGDGISFVASAAARATSFSTLTVNKPSDTQPGDFMIAFVWRNDTDAVSLSGWTSIKVDNSADGDANLTVFSKVAGGSEPSTYSFGGNTATRTCVMLTFRGGVGAVDVQGAAVTRGVSTTLTATGVTATVKGLLLASYGTGSSAATITVPPAGMTLLGELMGVSGAGAAVYGLPNNPAGATGNKVATLSASVANGGWLIQLH